MKALWKIYDSLGKAHPRLTDYVVKIPPGGRPMPSLKPPITGTWTDLVQDQGVDSDQAEAAIKATVKMLNIIENTIKTSMKLRIAKLPGDGIGPEVIEQAARPLMPYARVSVMM